MSQVDRDWDTTDTASSLMSVRFQRRRQFAISDQFAPTMVNRQALGDWGDQDAEDVQDNTADLSDGNQLLSAYEGGDGFKG